MPHTLTHLRVVLASPKDVRAERDAFAGLIDQVNEDTARPAGCELELYRWETDASPGFHPNGPQGLIDKALRIEDCDLFVGILWNRIGTPTEDGRTGTEHEFDTAYRSWKSMRRPHIMFYFNQRASRLAAEELDQRKRVLAFQRDFPEEGLYCAYNGKAKFVEQVGRDLRRFVRHHVEDNGKGDKAHLNAVRASSGATTYSVKMDTEGWLQLPKRMMQQLRVREGDTLKIGVVGSEIDSVLISSKSRFNADVIGLLSKRLRSATLSISPAEVTGKQRKGK